MTASAIGPQTPISPNDIPAEAVGCLTIDLDALAENYRTLQLAAPDALVAGVIKANGYGLGLEPVAVALAEAGCTQFFVADLDEGRRLRAVLPEAIIYILDGLFPGTQALFAQHRLRPCLSSLDEAGEWADFCRTQGPLPAALHIDTGMNRRGLSAGEAAELARDPAIWEAFDPSLMMSHLACADTPSHGMNRRQLDRFRRHLEGLPQTAASLCNTAGVFLGPEYHFDVIRAGIGLFGGTPFADRDHPFLPVAYLDGRIMQVRDIGPGDPVGYGADYVAPSPRRLAVISVGYGDGYFRALGSSAGKPGGVVAIGGHKAPVVGRVSMDMIAADVTDVPSSAVRRGGVAELLGRHVTVNDLARAAGTIAYEILTNLGDRPVRRYTSGDRISQSPILPGGTGGDGRRGGS